MESFLKKCGAHAIAEFEGWPVSKLNERELVYFGVKKEHDMGFKYDTNLKVLTYDELVIQAIESGENEFEYHNHFYTVQKNEDGGYDVISNEEKVADVVIADEERIVLIDDRKKDYVRNTKSAYYGNMYKNELTKVRTRSYLEKDKRGQEI